MIDDLIKEEMIRQEMEKMGKRPQAQAPAAQPPQGEDIFTPSQFLQAAKPAVLPTLGQAAGTLAGMASGPLAPYATPTLEALGGMGGEYLNQKLGITPPSTGAMITQGVLPAAARGAAAVGRLVPSSTKGATFLNEIAPLEAKTRMLGFAAPETASDLFAKAEASKVRIPTMGTRDAIKTAISELSGSSAEDLYKGTREYLYKLDNTLAKNQGALKPTQYQKELRDLNAKLKGAEGKKLNSVEFGRLMEVKDALTSALEGAPAGSDLAKARSLSNRESVLDDINDAVKEASSTAQGQGELKKFRASEVLNLIDKDEKFQRRFAAAFTPKEQSDIKKIFTKLNEIPALPSAQAGLNRAFGDMSQGLKAGAASSLLGVEPATATGIGLASMAVRPTMDTAKVLKLALTTQEGRKALLKELTVQKGKSVREVMQKVATALSSVEPAQTAQRELFGTTGAITPFGNER